MTPKRSRSWSRQKLKNENSRKELRKVADDLQKITANGRAEFAEDKHRQGNARAYPAN